MILQWLKKRKINELEVEIAELEASLNHLLPLKTVDGNVPYFIVDKINRSKSRLAGVRTKLKQLKND